MGTKVEIHAMGVVVSASKRADKDGMRIDSSVQITDMALDTEGKDVAKILFGEGE